MGGGGGGGGGGGDRTTSISYAAKVCNFSKLVKHERNAKDAVVLLTRSPYILNPELLFNIDKQVDHELYTSWQC